MNEVLNLTMAAFAGFVLGGGLVVLVLWLYRTGRISSRGSINPVPEDVRTALEGLEASVVILNKYNQVLSASAPARAGGFVEFSRLISQTLVELVDEVRQTQTAQDVEAEVVRAGIRAKASIHAKAAPLNDGCVILIIDDRTDAQLLEETRRDFVANVSHELKTPISAISLLAEVIRDNAEDTEIVKKYASNLLDEAKRLTSLVQDIIQLSRVQATEVAANAKPVSLNAVIAEAISRNQITADKKGIELRFVPNGDKIVVGDFELLASLVKNLIENAVVYSDSGKQVAIGLSSANGFAEIAVIDNGIGISPEDSQRVFERFYRADASRSRGTGGTGGTGLGLAIARNIAVKHGGQLRLFSKLGLGSTFTVSLPLQGNTSNADQNNQNEADEK